MEEKDLKILAQNLANPQGEKGIQIGEMMHATNIGMTLESIHSLLIEDSEHILEIGHGNAGHLKSFLKIAKDLKYTGIDISETMHHEAENLNIEFKIRLNLYCMKAKNFLSKMRFSIKYLPSTLFISGKNL